MRPLFLKMTAFGPYAGSQELDFTELGDCSLFLIHGPTGAGKSTILDAICFALYGRSSGNEREADQLRSDHAGPETDTEVELRFRVGGKCYQVVRSPAYLRQKKYGDGLTISPTSASLVRLGPDNQEEEVLASKSTNVTNEVEKILGFSVDQFRQVIMLPQGKFRELLTAKSEDREGILAKLFDTSIYKKIEYELRDRARELRGLVTRLTNERKIHLETLDCENDEEVEEKYAALGKEKKAAQAEADKLKLVYVKADTELNKGLAIAEKFQSAEVLEKEKQLLDAKLSVINTKRAIFENAQRALKLTDIYQQFVDEKTESSDATTQFKSSQENETLAKQLKKEASEKDKACKELFPREEQLNEALLKLEGMVSSLEAFEQAKCELITAKSARERCLQVEVELRNRVKGSKNQKVETIARLSELSKAKVDLELLEQKRRDLDKALNGWRTSDEIGVNLEKARDDVERKKIELSNQEIKRNNFKKALEQAQEKRLHGQAAFLARTLVPGEACPVCGSDTHPSPAADLEGMPEENDIQLIRDQLAVAEQSVMDAVTAVNSSANRLVQFEERLRGLVQQLQESGQKSLTETQQNLDEVGNQIQTQTELSDQIRRLEKKVQIAELEITAAEDSLESAASELQLANGTLQAAETRLEEREKSVPVEYREKGALVKAIAGARQERDQLRETREKAAKNLSASSEAYIAAKEKLDAARQLNEKCREKLQKRVVEWAARLSAEGFADEKVFLDARMKEDELNNLKLEIGSFDKEVTRVTNLLEVARKNIEGLVKVDTDELGQRKIQAADFWQNGQNRATELGTQLRSFEETRKRLKKVLEDLETEEGRYAVLGRLETLSKGTFNSLSLQRFVLAALLDDVLLAASERLLKMSKSRYRLQRTRVTADNPKSAGLDLEVEDAYTGKNRSVATLSGGESFLTSLSLALGLADVVQAYSGGIWLETIFVDEGFGSLDEEALDLAVDILMDLRESGRLVGVISHVAEMKERIDAQLVVSSDRHLGASAEFRLP